MHGFILLILIIYPTVFQIILGRKAIRKNGKPKFWLVCLISFTLQIICSIAAFLLEVDDFQKGLEGNGTKCGNGLIGIIVIELFFTLLLLIVMISQYAVKTSRRS